MDYNGKYGRGTYYYEGWVQSIIGMLTVNIDLDVIRARKNNQSSIQIAASQIIDSQPA
jgi:hypothetical protein